MYSSAAVRSLVETWAAENNVGRVRSFHASLTGMVLPNDDIEVKLQHVGMVAGRKIITVEASNKETEDKVLLGTAEVEQPVSSYVFTGQGSQEQGMGMELYASSPVAKEVWDRADKHFMDNYGEPACLFRTHCQLLTFVQDLPLPTSSRTILRSLQFTLVELVERLFVKTTLP
jgi:fatty acid synthase subunit beta